MEVGDLVQHTRGWPRRGIIVKRVHLCSQTRGVANKIYDVFWQDDSSIEHEVWDYNLESLNEKSLDFQ
jgi:hypothetical protein